MGKTSQAVENVRSLAAKLTSIVELCDVLDRIGSVENAEAEALKRVEKVNAEVEKAKKELLKVEENIKKAQDGVAAHNSIGEKVINEAKQEAAKIIDEAKAKAKSVTDNAKTKAQSVIDEADKKQSLANDINVAIETKQKELSELEGKIASLKEHAAKILG